MSNDTNEILTRLFKLWAMICKMIMDGKRDAAMVADCLQKIVDEQISCLIPVDRTIRPTYPNWVDPECINDPKFVALEKTGPNEFDVSNLEQWLHDKQRSGTTTGNVIYDHLKSNNMLEGCPGLRDLEEIQKKGVAFFREHFKGKVVFGMKSVVRHAGGSLYAPCLIEDDGGVVLSWRCLGYGWYSDYPALRFAS